MWIRFRLWLHQFNPVAIWREEKHLDREAQILIVQELCATMREQASVATKALELSHLHMKAFEPVDGETRSYVVRDDDEVKAAAERMGIDLDKFDSDSNPFTFY